MGIFHEPQNNTLKQTFSPEISIKNLRQPEILLNKQWKTPTKRFFALNFL
jgi:hypothetical protein